MCPARPVVYRRDMRELIAAHRGLALFFAVYYLTLVAYGVWRGVSATIFYVIFVGGGALLVARLYPRGRFSTLVLWSLAGWGLAHMIGGLVEVDGRIIYEFSAGGGELRFDKAVHFFGFGAATLAAYELLRRTVAPDAAAGSVAVAAVFVGLGIGAVTETIEFLITLLPGDTNVGGFTNTGWDLVANALGVVAAARVALLRERAGSGIHAGASPRARSGTGRAGPAGQRAGRARPTR